jgi:peptide/nickel transport system substrate-binding protein
MDRKGGTIMSTASTQTMWFTRRGLLTAAGAGFVGAAAAPSLSWRPLAAHAQGAPKKGGTLRVAYAEEPKNLHTQIDSGTEGVYAAKQIYDSLLNIDPTGKIVPGLATGMPERPSNLVYVFKLRNNVRFHNGKPFTADDVLWTFDRLLGKIPGLQSTQASRFVGIIASVEKVDPSTVRFTLKKPSPDFLVLMGGDKYMGIMQKDSELADPKEYGQSIVVGTGPFKFKEWKKGSHLTLVRNDDYWGPPALVDQVVYRAIPEASTRMVAMRAGEIDVLLAPTLKDVRQYQNDRNFKVLTADGGNMKLFIFNTARAPFNDLRVRQAMAYAVNREEIVEAIYYGYASVAHDLLPPWNAAHDPSRKYYPYDPERAKKLLAEAGYGPAKPLEFEIVTSDATEFVDLSTLIQAQLQRVGVRAKVLSVDKSAYTAKTFPQRGTVNPNFQASVYRLIFGFPTSDYGWRSYHPKSALDLTGYNQAGGAHNPAVPPLLEEAAETLDVQAQRRLYGQLADLINADMPMLRIAFQKNVIISRAAVMDLGITVISNMPLRGVWLNQ